MQVRNLVLTVMGLGQPPSASQKAGLVRDAFGLHKMMVIVTASGKVCNHNLEKTIPTSLKIIFKF